MNTRTKVEPVVEEIVIGGPNRAKGVVRGGVVIKPVIGGPDRVAGYVEGGVGL